MKKIIALIPARGGSKGVPLKNLKKISGIHLVARSVLAAKGSELIDSVYVSSDSREILDVASDVGAIPILRPSEYAQDQSSTEDVLLHFCDELQKQGINPQILVYLQCTSPFTTSNDVNLVINSLLENDSIDCAFAAIEDHSFIWKIDNNGVGYGINHEAYKQRKRRQDLSKSYKETGAVYAVRLEKLVKFKNRFGNSALPVTLNQTLPFEIDNPFELKLARTCSDLFEKPIALSKIEKIKAIVFDFDGTMTNDKVYVNDKGEETVRCSRADGLGVDIIKSVGIKVLILTREENNVVLKRANKIGVEIINGVRDKLSVLKAWAKLNKITSKQIIYVGNDINDLTCLEWAGIAIAPNDAHPDILETGVLKLKNKGGDGVVREIADLIISNKYK